jgi:hypothetical protein
MENLPYVMSGSEESSSSESNGSTGNKGGGTGKSGIHALFVGVLGLGIGSASVSGNHLSSLESPETGVGGGSLGLVVRDGEGGSGLKTISKLLTLGGFGLLFVLDLLGGGFGGNTVVNTSGGEDGSGSSGEGNSLGEIVISFHDESSSGEHSGNERVSSHGGGLITTVGHNASGTSSFSSDARTNVSFLNNVGTSGDGNSGHVTIGEVHDGLGGVHSEHGSGQSDGRGVAPGSGIKGVSSNLDHLLLSFLF